jgi:hypothetical protein
MVELSASSEAAAFAIAEAGLAELHSRIEFVASGNAGGVSGSAAGAARHDTGSSTNLITLRQDSMHGQLKMLACGQLQMQAGGQLLYRCSMRTQPHCAKTARGLLACGQLYRHVL